MSNNITYKIKSIPDGFEIYDPSDNQLNLGDIALLSELKVKYVTSPKAENFYIKITDTDDTDETEYTISVTTVKDEFIDGGSNRYDVNTYLKYTKNGEDWFLLISNGEITPITGLRKNSKVYFKGILKQKSTDPFTTFTVTKNNNEKAKFEVGGNILTLTNDKDTSSQTIPPHAFGCLFSSSHIVSASDLRMPLTTSEYCFYKMFDWCITLTTVPSKLPATTLANNCYQYMFYWSSNLTTAPELPATALTESCYQDMFRGCISLTTAPVLSATTLAENCYNGMFSECTSLTTAPELPATTLADFCYNGMFGGCTKLTTTPSELPAMTLKDYCYNHMFSGCTSLETAPVLPATNLSGASYCYNGMFYKCTGLTTAPELPATTLADYCYYYMFNGCTSLRSAPELPATTLRHNCYSYMFYGCTNLNYIKAMFTTTPDTYYMNNWVDGVAPSGAFVKNAAATWTSSCGTSTYPCNWVLVSSISDITGTTQLQSPSYVTVTNAKKITYIKKSTNQTVYISVDHTNWTEMVLGTIYTTNNSTIYMCGKLTAANTSSDYTNFYIDGENVSINGNLNSMWSYDNVNEQLKAYCGYNMFNGCTSLITAPALPATTLAGGCYQQMFYGCTNLTTAPSELPAMTLKDYCYYYMFSGCISLETAPELPATTLVNSCYSAMFNGCSKLNYIKAMFTTTPSMLYTANWVYGIASSGTFVKNAAATWSVSCGASTYPCYWRVTTPPS